MKMGNPNVKMGTKPDPMGPLFHNSRKEPPGKLQILNRPTNGRSTRKRRRNGAKKPTAKDMKAAREKVDPKEDRRTSFNVAELEAQDDSPSIVKDEIGRDVPENLKEHHSLAPSIKSAGTKLDQVKKLVRELSGHDGGEFLPLQQIEMALKDVKGLITQSRYWTACPRKHHGKGACDRCDGHGYIPFSRRGKLSDDDKEALGS